MTPEQRREAFIADIVEVCKRHRVSVRINWYTVQIEFVYCDDPKESAI